ncbi:hypothetical protein DICPUDRAFT_42970 [Dictyostelium purpureum]|uniref:NADH dehydrogenase [ubiquinone] 1 alpha subcomplex assembly factor 3 n=1 Tax=Dictyostelium purpureum TaxID=5786 RepID=F1A389_DICPU|nr:uncharacterized protein DICPUDRAFT_42970 [Dictyostelium purpureum]EGC29343.1 hypothetical protein DICPUDRAFT_42970 [Dictyostelium purpureum]|eukprot:XP_003294133.1 hypothetical protein DICPUDRAFT_42970 [Dictyostelium purpureum]
MNKSNKIIFNLIRINKNLNKTIPYYLNNNHFHNKYYNNKTKLVINNDTINNFKQRNYCTGLESQNIFDSHKGSLSEIYSIDGYSDSGFSINKVLIPGSICIMPHQLFLWDIHSPENITIDSLAPLDIIEPKCEFLIIGTGNTSYKFSNEFLSEIQTRYQMNLETMSTSHAIGTYNILSEEGRRVAAFILPPVPLPEFKDPYFVKKSEYEAKGVLERAGNILDLNTDLIRKKQTLIRMKLDESNNEAIKLIEKQISKIEKDLGDNIQEQDKPFDSYFIPTRNVEEGFIKNNDEENEQNEDVEKKSVRDRAIIWFVKKFGKYGEKK